MLHFYGVKVFPILNTWTRVYLVPTTWNAVLFIDQLSHLNIVIVAGILVVASLTIKWVVTR